MQSKDNKKFSYLDEFKIIKTLGSGYHAQVKLGMDPNGNLFAIKRYKKQTASLKTLEHQLNVMKILQHENLVRLYDVRENATYQKKDDTTYKCFAIILEYVGGGQLFDFVAETGKFSEKVTRTYFHQMMNGLYYMHCRGYAHRDIKPQNILLSRDFSLKLADFGFTCALKGKDGSGILHTKLGTEGYMAPQIPSKNYKGTEADIFAAGVILFIMYAGSPPFERSNPNDPYYRLIKQKNYDLFWKAHSKSRSQSFFSQHFKDLFVKMVSFQPSQRPSIQQIAAHPWVRGKVCTQSEIRDQFQLRKKKLDFIMQKKRQQQQAQRNAIEQNTINVNLNRGQSEVNQNLISMYQNQLQTMRKLTHLQPKHTDDFEVEQNISYIIASLKYFFENKKQNLQTQLQSVFDVPLTLKIIKIQDNQNYLRVVYEYCIQLDRDVYKSQLQIEIHFGQTEDDKIAICLDHVSGNRLYYKKIAKQIKNIFAYCLD